MKKITLLAGLALALTIGVNAQTKVSKQIKVLDWLNVAVVDGNQVEGGLHSYDAWTDVLAGTPKLKLAQVKKGMLITITSENATYRLKSWATTTALPLKGEWERVGDVVVVADMAARDALIVTDNSKPSLAIGTTVLVGKNALNFPESFIYVGGTVDVNADGVANASDIWFSFGNSAANSGYIYFGSVDPATTNPFTGDFSAVALADGFINDGNGVAVSKTGIASTDKKLASLVSFKVALPDAATVPVIAFPKAWSKPTFVLKSGTDYSQLADCWMVHYIVKDGVDYQVWVADNAFAKGSSGTELIVR